MRKKSETFHLDCMRVCVCSGKEKGRTESKGRTGKERGGRRKDVICVEEVRYQARRRRKRST